MQDKKKTSKTVDERRFVIHPGVGIARVGNSPDEYFIGPEARGWRPTPVGGYKDAAGRVKRQAARFRIFEIDANGKALREWTGADCDIEWTAHLANKKGAWFNFVGRFQFEDAAKHVLRNRHVQGSLAPDERDSLIIDPGPHSISGHLAGPVPLRGGRFLSKEVGLGELRTDELGRLLVLGGLGTSDTVTAKNPITHYANNDGWHDDTSDGPIRAVLSLPDGSKFEAKPAWVLVAPPNFAPEIDNLVRLDDVVREVALEKGWIAPHKGVEFHRDIFPILAAGANFAWVNAVAYRGHGAGMRGAFLDDAVLKTLSDPSDASKAARQAVFQRVRVPHALADAKTQKAQANPGFMPILSGDDGDAAHGKPRTWLTVLPSQFRNLEEWASGRFTVEKPAEAVVLEALSIAEQPEALDRGALEPCVGGPFYPGIEMTFVASEHGTWSAPYRINETWKAGDVTKWMAVPWQADFFECAFHWWPAQRPDDVLPEDEYMDLLVNFRRTGDPQAQGASSGIAAAAGYRAPWARGLPQQSPAGDNAMVKYWNELGFVVREKAPTGETVYVERQRRPSAGMDVRELFFKLMNVESFEEVLPKAREYVEQCLQAARDYQRDPDTAEMWRPFRYTRETFQARVMETYRSLVEDVEAYDPARDAVFTSREKVAERIRQFSPFNMSDGSWLRNITRIGPIDEARALLFSVLMDEMGDGEVAHNHSNIYRDLCHSIGYYPSDCTSRDFAFNPDLLDSAFEVPTFELAISQFSETWYPELLGMTLQLELGIVEAKNTIALMEYYGFDAKYWIMHVGIDNPVNGHAARAMRAIELYLDNIRANGGGEAALQAQWRRIWDGYVAFGTTGTFGDDFAKLLAKGPSLAARVEAMITSKATYGSLNHGDLRLGNTPINELFLDPPTFLKELVNAGYFLPGDPENSPFFRLVSFDTGRMYRVFTPDELKLWEDWCRSLGASPTPPPKPDPYSDMVRVVRVLRNRQEGTPGHASALLEKPGTGEPHTVAWWFEQPTRDFLEALALPSNGMIVPGNPDASFFIQTLLAPEGSMGSAFDDPVPGLRGATGRQVAIAWIAAGCPIPPAPGKRGLRNLWLASTVESVRNHSTRMLVGMAAIH
ncbi:MAG: hypothetical protein GC161_12060 [Planctomycetaceae bacterium]|nr:hypothetical protein [Planctomycetaceae bacterium]